MVFIKAEGNPMASLSPEQQQQHIQKVGHYIQQHMEEGKMLAAQPLEFDGKIISNQKGSFTDAPFTESKEVITGYYHLKARDLTEAEEITKKDPRFGDTKWTMEIRPVLKVDGINKD